MRRNYEPHVKIKKPADLQRGLTAITRLADTTTLRGRTLNRKLLYLAKKVEISRGSPVEWARREGARANPCRRNQGVNRNTENPLDH
jgi:hypothetical protein